MQTISIDTGVLGFTLLVAIATGILFGLAPARQGFRADPNDSLKDTGTRGATGGSRRSSRALVAAEIALALVLVIGAGLMVKSLLRLQQEAPGYEASGLMTFNLNLPFARYPNTEPRDFYRRLLEEIRSVPGVQSAAAINFAPMTNFGFNGTFTVVGQPAFEPGKAPVTEYRFISPGYFATMAIPVLRGSDFSDRNNETDRPVVIINDTMARTYFGGADPIGQQMQLGVDPVKVTREFIAVVADVRDAALSVTPVAEVFVPHAQAPLNAMAIVVRAAREMRMEAVMPSIRARVKNLDPDVAVIRPQMLQTAIVATAGNTRLISILTSVFALVAALLASLGVYSLIAYSVGYFLTQTLQTLLYEVRPTDPVVLLATCGGVFGVVLIASIVPAFRALRVDPMIALRAE